ncbi:MAG: aryl-sulfate sulfotransferase, partial [Bacteroidota bacterium]
LIWGTGCGKEDTNITILQPNLPDDFLSEVTILPNPYNLSPLTALLEFSTKEAVSIQLRVIGLHGSASDVNRVFPDLRQNFSLPVVGLYPNHLNQIELSLFNESGEAIIQQILTIQAEEQLPQLPIININKIDESRLTSGWNLVNYFGHTGQIFPQRPFMFDEFGDIRWYLDFQSDPRLANLFFDNGLNQLQNGNFIFGDVNTGVLYEITLLGEIVERMDLNRSGLGFHHSVVEKSDGQLIVTVDDLTKNTVEDVIVEIDWQGRKSITNKWDLNESLDNTRTVWESDISNIAEDWFHANSTAYDTRDNTIIVSGRTQGVVKLTAANEVVWILAPHKGWRTNGRGEDLNQFLLQPLDSDGQPIEDMEVLGGEKNHPEFEWAWYQHTPVLLPNGNLSLFDNGENRNYKPDEKYSRAVEYAIDETNKTIQQVWTYGKERGLAAYSRIVSKTTYHESTDNVLFTPGAILFSGLNYGKVIEINRLSDEIIFEATIIAPMTNFNVTFHNVQRIRPFLE